MKGRKILIILVVLLTVGVSIVTLRAETGVFSAGREIIFKSIETLKEANFGAQIAGLVPETLLKTEGQNLENQAQEDIPFLDLEKTLQGLVNQERVSRGLNPLKWNDKVAQVAREHSQNLAEENKIITDSNILYPQPFIHHEGLNFGLYTADRLINRGLNYFKMVGENIAFAQTVNKEISTKDILQASVSGGPGGNITLTDSFKTKTNSEKIETIKEEIEKREKEAKAAPKVNWLSITEKSKTEIEKEAIDVWMASPGHRDIILTPEFNEAGIGIAKVNEFLIITQVFTGK